MNIELLGSYANGNYTVDLYTDGTKIRRNDLDFFEASTIESADIKITNCCDRSCPMCHENSTPIGRHADILHQPWLEKLHPYCELAIGGGNPLEHPDLEKFLYLCQQRKHIANLTVNQVHFEQQWRRLLDYQTRGLIYGLGISLVEVSSELLDKLQYFPHAVIHVINGLVAEEQLRALAHKNLKVLILGYKKFRRGEALYQTSSAQIDAHIQQTRGIIQQIVQEQWFKVVSFDNLALKQLEVQSWLDPSTWKQIYMGDDGLDGQQSSATFFADLVEGVFAKNSCSSDRYPLMDTAEDMLAELKRLSEKS